MRGVARVRERRGRRERSWEGGLVGRNEGRWGEGTDCLELHFGLGVLWDVGVLGWGLLDCWIAMCPGGDDGMMG